MEPEEVRMTFVEHLEELRRRIFKALLALVAAAGAALCFYEELVDLVTRPHFRAMEMLGRPEASAPLLGEGYAAAVLSIMKLGFLVGLFAASPVVAYQAWAFVRSGLYARERRWVRTFAPASFALFLAGCALGFFVLLPCLLYGMARMLPPAKIAPLFGFSDYLTLVTALTLLVGAVFQVPLVMAFLSRAGLVEPAAFARRRALAGVANLVAAALVAPGDPLSLLLCAAPLLLLYEGGIVAARWAAAPRAPSLGALPK